MITSPVINEKIQKLNRNNVTYLLLALSNYYKYVQKDEYKIIDVMFTQIF